MTTTIKTGPTTGNAYVPAHYFSAWVDGYEEDPRYVVTAASEREAVKDLYLESLGDDVDEACFEWLAADALADVPDFMEDAGADMPREKLREYLDGDLKPRRPIGLVQACADRHGFDWFTSEQITDMACEAIRQERRRMADSRASVAHYATTSEAA